MALVKYSHIFTVPMKYKTDLTLWKFKLYIKLRLIFLNVSVI